MRRAADEPRIRAALRRAGLAADGLLAELRRLARAIRDDRLQQAIHLRDRFRLDNPRRLRLVAPIPDRAAFGADAENAIGVHGKAAVGQDGIRGGHFQRLHLAHAKREREAGFRREIAGNAEPGGGFLHAVKADAAKQVHGGGVQRLFEGVNQAHGRRRMTVPAIARPARRVRLIADRFFRRPALL